MRGRRERGRGEGGGRGRGEREGGEAGERGRGERERGNNLKAKFAIRFHLKPRQFVDFVTFEMIRVDCGGGGGRGRGGADEEDSVARAVV